MLCSCRDLLENVLFCLCLNCSGYQCPGQEEQPLVCALLCISVVPLMPFDFYKKSLFLTEWQNWKSSHMYHFTSCLLTCFLPKTVGLFFFGEVFIFKHHSIDPIRYLTYLFLCILLLFLGKERAVLGTFHDSVIFLDWKQNLCAPAVGKLTWFCRLRIFLEGLQQLAWRCKGVA